MEWEQESIWKDFTHAGTIPYSVHFYHTAVNKCFSGSGLSEILVSADVISENLSKVHSKKSIFGELREDFSLFMKLYNAGWYK